MARIVTRTSKGLRETSGKTSELADELREVLRLCKGRLDLDALPQSDDGAERTALALAMDYLVDAGFLREITGMQDEDGDGDDDTVPVPGLASRKAGLTPAQSALAAAAARRLRGSDQALAASQQAAADAAAAAAAAAEEAKRERLQQIRAEGREQARRESEEKARREAEEQARREAEEKARVEAEEQVRKEAEEKARRDAEAALRREAEEKVRREVEEQARREAEERARLEAEARARREAEEKARREAEELARREAAERERLAAEERARQEAEEQARRDAEERQRREAEEWERERLARRERSKRRTMSVGAGLMTFAIAAAVVVGVQWIPFSGKRGEFEAAASAAMGVPVKAERARVSLFSGTGWVLDHVSVGSGVTATPIKQVKLQSSAGSLFGKTVVRGIEFVDARLSWPGIVAALQTKAGGLPFTDGLVLGNATIAGGRQPPLHVELKVAQGRLLELVARGQEGENESIELSAQATEGGWAIRAVQRGKQVQLPIGIETPIRELTVEGTLLADRFEASKIVADLGNGEVSFGGTVTWQGGWNLAGKFVLRSVDMSKLAPAWFKSGFLRVEGDVVAQAREMSGLWSGLQVAGDLKIPNGELAGIDLERVVEHRGQGEQTYFETITGRLLFERGTIDVGDLGIAARAVDGGGRVSIAPDAAVSGQVGLVLRAGSARGKGVLNVGGSVGSPSYSN